MLNRIRIRIALEPTLPQNRWLPHLALRKPPLLSADEGSQRYSPTTTNCELVPGDIAALNEVLHENLTRVDRGDFRSLRSRSTLVTATMPPFELIPF